jgi:hypothetical protein
MTQTPIIQVIVIDHFGRELEVPAPMGAVRVLVGLNPIGAIEFNRTDETNAFGRPIYRQVTTPIPDELLKAAKPSLVVSH